MKLASTRIITVDVPTLARFYEKITGIAPVETEDFVQFATGGENLAIGSKRSADLYQPGAGTAANNRSMIVEIEADDVDHEQARLKDIVKVWVLEPTDQPWGYRSMLFRDPDGNLINFYAPIEGEKR